MKRRFAASLLAISIASLGCERREQGKAEPIGAVAKAQPSANVAPSASPRELAFGDTKVHFFGSLPARSAEKPPFVLVLHGLGGSGSEVVEALGLRAFANAKRFLFAAPDGTLDGQGRRFWNANEVCCNFGRIDVDDVDRLTALIDYAVGRLNADPERVFVVGYSNGGFMAHRLACERATRLRAIVSIAAAGPAAAQRCEPKRAVRVLEIHGTDDPIVPFDGGHLFGREELPRTASVAAGLEPWARAARCENGLRPSQRIELVAGVPGADTEVLSYSGCGDAAPVLWKIAGAGHVIPLDRGALDTIWQFLSEKR